MTKNYGNSLRQINFCSVLVCSVLFCFALFYSVHHNTFTALAASQFVQTMNVLILCFLKKNLHIEHINCFVRHIPTFIRCGYGKYYTPNLLISVKTLQITVLESNIN